MKERAVTVATYAKMIDRTTAHVYQLIKDGKVKSEVLGKRATFVILNGTEK